LTPSVKRTSAEWLSSLKVKVLMAFIIECSAINAQLRERRGSPPPYGLTAAVNPAARWGIALLT
jgi:hypothetical protein